MSSSPTVLRADSASGYRFSAIATLAAAIAGIVSLSGILRLRISDLRSIPAIQMDGLPAGNWPQQWLSVSQTARVLQANAVAEWLNVVLGMIGIIVIVAGLSALIALFAYASARRYEVALAGVVGASRKHLRTQQLERAALNACVALLLGITTGLFAAWVAHETWPSAHSGIAPFAWLVGSVLFAIGIAGIAANGAATRMSKPGWLGDAIAPEARTNPGYGAEELRRALLHAQFAFTFALIASALLVAQHANREVDRAPRDQGAWITRITLGEHTTPLQRRAAQQSIRAQLRDSNAGSGALASAGTLIGVGPTDRIISHCGPCTLSYMYVPMFPLRTQQHVVGENFFELAGVPLLAGREFQTRDGAANYIVVNDTFAGMAFLGQHAIGKRIQVGGLRGTWYTVIGVVKDIPISGLLSFAPDDRSLVKSNRLGREPAIYFHAAQHPPAVFDVVTERPVELRVAGVVSAAKPRASLIAEARAPAAWFAGVLGALAAAAAIVAVFSLGSMTLLNVKQQEIEIAARRAVGARRRDIVRMVVANNAGVAGRGVVVGLVLSVAVARAIQMVWPQMDLFNFRVAVIATLLLATVSMIAAIIPARAAAQVPPARIHV